MTLDAPRPVRRGGRRQSRIIDDISGLVAGVSWLDRLAASPVRTRTGRRQATGSWPRPTIGVGLGIELALLAIRHALRGLPFVPANLCMSVNASPETVMSGALGSMLASLPFGRIVIAAGSSPRVSRPPPRPKRCARSACKPTVSVQPPNARPYRPAIFARRRPGRADTARAAGRSCRLKPAHRSDIGPAGSSPRETDFSCVCAPVPCARARAHR